jgi:hypothetical protein
MKSHDPVGSNVWPVSRDENSVLEMSDLLGNAANGGRDYGQPCSHRFEGAERESLAPRKEDEYEPTL